MFLNVDKVSPNKICAIAENGDMLDYGELGEVAKLLSTVLPPRSLVFNLCSNTLGSLCGYVGMVSAQCVPLLLDSQLEGGLFNNLLLTYKPGFLWVPKGLASDFPYPVILSLYGYSLLKTGFTPFTMDERLALLIPTSGSTGSPKLVRLSFQNLTANTQSIVAYLELDETERPITTLPMNYVYGLSIINSHLWVGATLLMTSHGVLQKEFWDFFKKHEATSFGGVPYTYEMLYRLRFFNMELPSLRTMTQAGGKLLPQLHQAFAEYAANTGRHFYIMYGASEATARMGYLPYQDAVRKCGCMGIAIPGGSFSLLDDDGNEISTPGIAGELRYQGANVSLGYAETLQDLARGDDFDGVYLTGDIATQDEAGYYTIVGRKNRFLKLFGNRVNLQEVEGLLQQAGYNCLCGGQDDLLKIYMLDDSNLHEAVRFISETTGLNAAGFKAVHIKEVPRNQAGKVLYNKLEQLDD